MINAAVGIKMTPLVIADRCDYCSAQALVKLGLLNGDLQFCGHHYAKHETNLSKAAVGFLDNRASLNSATISH